MGILTRNREELECLHARTVTVLSAGLERVICEGCGHLSFRYQRKLTGEVDRARFVREVDRMATAS